MYTKNTKDTVFNQYISSLKVKEIFDELNSLKVDKYTKKLSIIKFISLLIFAQLKEEKSLTDISLILNNNKDLQEIIKLQSISTSQLSRKLKNCPEEALKFILNSLIRKLRNKFGMKKANEMLQKVYLIDSSTISMCLSTHKWAEFRKTKGGVKLHLRLVFCEKDVFPDKEILTPAKKADKTQFDELIEFEKDALYIFDRGYVDYKKFDFFSENSIRFITRVKDNALIETIEEKEVPLNSPIKRESIVRLGKKSAYLTKNLYRLIEIVDEKGKFIKILTNDFSLSLNEISDLYRKRWQIELFFKWIKQHLVIKSVYGNSQSAVYNQIRISLITFCLSLLLKENLNYEGNLLTFHKYLRLCWSEPFSAFIGKLVKSPTKNSIGRRKIEYNFSFEQTVIEYTKLGINQFEDLNELVYEFSF